MAANSYKPKGKQGSLKRKQSDQNEKQPTRHGTS